jgi:hypothetical protein
MPKQVELVGLTCISWVIEGRSIDFLDDVPQYQKARSTQRALRYNG